MLHVYSSKSFGFVFLGSTLYLNSFLWCFAGIVGEIGESKDEYYIWTHKKLNISYNNDQIVDVSLTSESKAKLVPNSKLSFTYEVNHLSLIYL